MDGWMERAGHLGARASFFLVFLIRLHRPLFLQLRSIDGVTIYGPNPHTHPHRAALAAFNVAGLHASDVSALLDSAGVAVRAGHHCAQPLHAALGVPASARASPYIYNTPGEVVEFGKQLREAIQFFRDAGM